MEESAGRINQQSGADLQVVARLEQRDDAHRTGDAHRLLQKPHGEHVRGVVRHRDDVRAETLWRQVDERAEGVDHLAHLVAHRHVGGEQRPLREQLLLDP